MSEDLPPYAFSPVDYEDEIDQALADCGVSLSDMRSAVVGGRRNEIVMKIIAAVMRNTHGKANPSAVLNALQRRFSQ